MQTVLVRVPQWHVSEADSYLRDIVNQRKPESSKASVLCMSFRSPRATTNLYYLAHPARRHFYPQVSVLSPSALFSKNTQ